MIAGPLVIFILGFIVGAVITWKIAGRIMLWRVRNEGIESEHAKYDRRTKKWL